MNILAFLTELKDNNIHIGLQGDELRVSGATKGVSPELVERIRANKPTLVRFLHSHREGGAGHIRRAPALDTYPLTYAQRQLWLTDQASAAGQAYNLSFRQSWNGEIREEILEQALFFLIGRQEILRTVFVEDGGVVTQRVIPPEKLGTVLHTRRIADRKDLGPMIQEELEYRFDLAVGPLLRVALFSGPDSDHLLLFTLHHIIADAWSVPILLKELKEAYAIFRTGRQPDWPGPAIQYRDFAYWQQYLFPAAVRQAAKNYWLDCFTPLPVPVELDGCGIRPPVRTFRGRQRRLVLGGDNPKKIRAFCHREEIKTFAFLITMFNSLAFRCSGSADLCVGIPLAGRIYPEIQQGIGYYVNMIALRTTVSPEADFSTYCRHVDRQLMEGQSFQEYPFDQLIEDLEIPYDASRSPLFSWLLNYERKEANTHAEEDTGEVVSTRNKFELEVDFAEYGDSITVQLRYNADLFTDDWAHRWLGDFDNWLSVFLADPHTRLRELRREEAASGITPDRPTAGDREAEVMADAGSEALDPTEKRLIPIWRDLLHKTSVGPAANFFTSGGHSLKAMQLSAAVFREFNVNLPIKDIFRLPTLREQALAIDIAAIRGAAGPDKNDLHRAIPRAPEAIAYPLSAGQRLLWLTTQQQESLLAYNMLVRRRWEGPVDLPTFRRACALLLERHESLRTGFVVLEGRVVQQILPAPDVPLPLVVADFRAEISDSADRLADREQQTTFSPDRAPLWRCRIVLLPDGSAECWLTMHHIISDGWSMEVLFRDLRELYRSLSEGRETRLPELEIQYKDYAVWQQERSWEEEGAYWRDRLKGELPLLDLPSDRGRPLSRSFRGGYLRRALGPELLEQVRDYARSSGCSEYTVLLSMVKLLLYRYTGQGDLIVGVPVAGRDRAGLQDQVGYYVNTLAIRSGAEGELTVAEYVGQIRDRLLEGQAHQWYPLDRLVEELGIVAEGSRNPLFDVMVNYERREGKWEGASAQEEGETWAKFDVTFHFTQYDRELVLLVTYSSELYEKERMDRLIAHWTELAGSALRLPGAKLRELEYVGPAERRLLLEEFQGREVERERGVTVMNLFEAQAERQGGSVAVVSGGRELTYGELNAEANRLADYLRREHKVGPNDCVGLMLDRSERLLIGLLGVLKAGGAYVPVDPSYPEQRCRYMAEDSGMKLMIGEKGYGEGLGVPVLRWEERKWEKGEADNGGRRSGPEDLVYVIYTSGSTGRPKGVMIRHHSLYNLCEWLLDLVYRPAGRPFRVGLTASISFDASAQQIFPALASGSALLIPTEEQRMDPVSYVGWLQSATCEVIDMTPSFLQIMLQTIKGMDRGKGADQACSALRHLLVGGEALQRETALQFAGLLPFCRLINVYGPTETCVDCTYKILDHDHHDHDHHDHDHYDHDPGNRHLVSIGRPVPNVRAYVTDAWLHPAGIGVYGELLIGGPGLAAGYCHRPDLTADKFIDHPSYGLVYRTGDIVRWSSDGELEYAGRADGQVKIRGYRIEPDEIEQVLYAFPGVRAAAVIVDRDRQELQAAVCWHSAPDLEGLQRHLKDHVPAYMIPRRFLTLEYLPRNASGKIDRPGLSVLLAAAGTPADDNVAGYTPAGTSLQATLVDIWEQLLGCRPIGIRDDFWERGGDSLKAMRLVLLLYDRLHKEAGIKDIFAARTIERLAALLERRSDLMRDPIVAVPVKAEGYPVSPAQRRLWVLDQLEDRLAAYNIIQIFRLPEATDIDAFRRSVEYLAERHEVLRTVFTDTGDGVWQKLIPITEWRAPVEVRLAATEGEHATLMTEYRATEQQRHFDLRQGPLFRLQLVGHSEGTFDCIFNIHHIIADAWSLELFRQELGSAYEAFRRGVQPSLPAPAIQYKDYSEWINRLIGSEAWAETKDYWRRHLQEPFSALDLPADFPRPAIKQYTGGHTAVALTPQSYERLRDYCERRGVSVFTGLYAALNILLYRYTGQKDLVTGMAVAGRSRPELQGQLGLYINLLPVRAELTDSLSFDRLITAMQELLAGHLDAQLYPFDQMVDDRAAPRDLSRSPVFDILVNHRMEDTACPFPPGRIPGPDTGFAKYDLTVDWVEYRDSILIGLNYSAALFTAERMERLLRHFERLLLDALRQPDQVLSLLQYIPEGERRLIDRFGGVADPLAEHPTDPPAERPADPPLFPAMIEIQAARQPSRPAIVFEGAEMSYEDLNTDANRLAAWLRQSQGVVTGDRIGVMMRRSADLITCLIGIIKAGACYVPIDPAYPAKRKEYLIDNSQLRLIIADRSETASGSAPVFPWEPRRWAAASVVNPPPIVLPDDPAYILYTSGSTGRPKGVVIPHRALAWFTGWYRQAASGYSRIGVTASINFDVSAGQIFGALSAGATLVLAGEERKLDARWFMQYLADQRVEMIDMTPSLLRALLQTLSDDRPEWDLQAVWSAGEPLTSEVAGLFFNRLGRNTRLFNLYGPTEACVYSTMEEALPPTGGYYRSIGNPLPYAQLRVLDEQGAPSGIGIPGELCIAGPGLAKEYWRQEELTAAVFAPHPDYGRLYRTGDQVRWTTAGSLEFLGRKDGQVKLRGIRIELAEIEQVILSYPGIHAAAVILASDREELLAFITTPGASDHPGLRQFLSEHLPAAWIPSTIVTLAELPRTANDKLDRQALLSYLPSASDSEERDLPVSETEWALLPIWKEILGQETVHAGTDFFLAGGHSLKAMRIMAEIQRRLNYRVTIRNIFDHPSVHRLGTFIDTHRFRGPEDIKVTPAAERYPATAGQYRIWLACQLEGGTDAYAMSGRFAWQGLMDDRWLQLAWLRLLDRHEILRTSFDYEDGKLFQLVRESPDEPFRFLDWSGLEAADIPSRLAAWHESERQAGFEMSGGKLIRGTVIRYGDRQYECWLTMHHIISDGWSMEVLFRDLRELYRSLSEGRETRLPELEIQYKDYAVWQQERSWEEEGAYWRDRLKGELPLLDLPSDRGRPLSRSFRGGYLRRALGPELLEQVRDYARSSGCSEYTVLLSMVKLLLYRYTGQGDLIVGVPVAGRDRAGLQDQVGYYVNTLAIRSGAEGELTVAEYVGQIRDRLLEGQAHQWYPLDRLVEELGIVAEGSRNPLFDVMVNYERREGKWEGASAQEEGETWAKFDVTFHFTQYDRELVLLVTYSSELYEKERMDRLIAHWTELAGSALRLPGAKLRELEYVGPAERRLLLEEFQGREVERERGVTVMNLFEAQAERQGGSVAVVSGGRELTYGELNAEANRLADYLRREHKVGPNDCVGLMLDRSERLLIGLLGVLKAGGAYVPVDPSYPEQRCRYMAEDSGMKLMIGEKGYGEGLGVPVLRWEERKWEKGEADNGGRRSGPEDLVYVIYTSGSTGRPKGVMIRHHSLYNLCEWHAAAFGVDSGSRATLYAGIGFDASAWELWPYLIRGAKVYPLTEAKRYQLKDLIDLYREEGITHAFLPTPVCEELMASGMPVPDQLCLLTGGDRLTTAPPASLRLYNNYGPTENTVVTTSIRVGSHGSGPIPIGRPIDNTKVYILDQYGLAAGIGIYGELFLGGSGLAAGYIGNPELTAERFPNLTLDTTERLYRTGDFGRWKEDGTIEFAGRRDHQLKIRGHRVELGEIERTLTRLTGVDRARVLAEGTGAALRLCGFYSGEADKAAVLAEVRQSLPAYMMPSVVRRLAEWPLTLNGKIDDSALLRMLMDIDDRIGRRLSPRSKIEFDLARLWNQVLGSSSAGPDDHFFASGGNSIKAIRLLSLIRKEWDIGIPLKELYHQPLLSQLADLIRGQGPKPGLTLDFHPSGNFHPSGAPARLLYLIPPILGTSTIYSGLTAKLASVFHCVGLQYPGFEPGQPMPGSLEDMAASFAAGILKGAESRPVYVLGYSLGATLAFETAKILETAGISCRLLLLDKSLRIPDTVKKYARRNRDRILTEELAGWLGPVDGLDAREDDGIGRHAAALFDLSLSWEPYGRIRSDILAIRAVHGTQPMGDWASVTSGRVRVAGLEAGHYDLLAHPGLAPLISAYGEEETDFLTS